MTTQIRISPLHCFNKSIVLVLFILLPLCFQGFSAFAQSGSTEKPKILVSGDGKSDNEKDGKEMAEKASTVSKQIAAELRKIFPCAQVFTRNEIAQLIMQDRENQLRGQPSHLKEYVGNINAQYSVSFTLYKQTNKSFTLSAELSNVWGGDGSGLGGFENGSWANISQMVTRIVEKMTNTEICPWLGTITYTEKSKKDTVIKNTNTFTTFQGVGAQDEETTINNEISNTWDIEKIGRTKIKGKVTSLLSINNKFFQVTVNVLCYGKDCYVTDEYAQTGDMINEHQTKDFVADSKEFTKGRIKVYFHDKRSNNNLKNGGQEYSIDLKDLYVKMQEVMHTEYEKHTSPCCEKDSVKVSFGPFGAHASFYVGGIGKPTDKNLTGHDTWKSGEFVYDVKWNLHK